MAQRKTTSRKRSTAARGRSGGRSTGARKKKAQEEVYELPGGFWRQIGAVLMIGLAVVFVVTWFGSGGSLLNKIDEGAMGLVGYGKFLIPVMLVYLAVRVFRSERNKLPPVMVVAAILMVIWAAGISGLPTYGTPKPTGGVVGEWMNDFALQAMVPGLAAFVYVVLMFVTALFMLQMSPATVFKGLANMFKIGQKEEDEKNAAVARRANKKVEAEGATAGGMGGFKINNAGAAAKAEPEEKKEEEKGRKRRRTMFGGMGKKEEKEPKVPVKVPKPVSAGPVEPQALVAVSDPNWKMPGLELFEKKQSPQDPGNVQQNALIIKNTLSEFGIEVEMDGANVGPRVTQYTMKPPAGVNLSRILARDKELALNLAVDKIRIEAPIPGTRLVGVELPNVKSADVRLRGVLESKEWKQATDPLTFVVGKDISGKAVVGNLAKMPHLLIAGTTGSGKSVMTNTLISSLLYRNAPSDLKLIIVDPKQVEMVQYNDIPHLLTPIITGVEKALSAMKWAVNEMERRYTLMAEEKVKNIVDYNKKMAKRGTVVMPDKDGNEQKHDGGKMPYIVVVIDEMADLMMLAGKDLEMLIVRIAQKGRASGIHLVLATQRPEVKVITGLIKANIPGRIAFAVGSQMDSRIMLDMGGAEKLLGKGDMLMLTTEMMGKPRRIQGAWASDDDVNNLTDFLREQRPPEYNDEVVSQSVQIKGVGPSDGGSIGDMGRKYDPTDATVRKAVEISLQKGKFSTAMLQTYLGKGHGYVSGLALWFEEIGVIGPSNGNKPREVLITTMEEFDQMAGM